MGRKIKEMLLICSAIVILACSQSVFTAIQGKGEVKAAAKEMPVRPGEYPGNSENPEEPELAEEPEEPENPENPDNPENPESPEKPEEPEEPEEPLKRFQVAVPEPSGLLGYYIEKPTVEILHSGSRGKSLYKLTHEGGTVQCGELTNLGEKAVIGPENFREGTYVLEVWMQDQDGTIPDEMREFYEMRVDTVEPDIQIKVPAGFDTWYQTSPPVYISASDGSSGSGIRKIACYADGKLLGTADGDAGVFRPDRWSLGGKPVVLCVEVSDQAGHVVREEKKLLIDGSAPETEITGAEKNKITGMPVELHFCVKEENVLRNFSISGTRQRPDGETEALGEGAWVQSEDAMRMTSTFEEDGIYDIELYAEDRAGNQSRRKARFMIDTNNPVISGIDKLNGKYLQEFRWNEEAEDMIWDFTSYTHEVLLDNQLYHIGNTVKKEGKHLLKVRVKDAAGNLAEAQAGFIIDHTAPEIWFRGVEDGGTYEKEQEMAVQTEDPSDQITEVRVNGETQQHSRAQGQYIKRLKECGKYEVIVSAQDKAGNKSIKTLCFRLVPQKTALQKAVEPVMRKLGLPVYDKEGRSLEGMNMGIAAGAVAVGAGVLIAAASWIAAYIIRKKRKQ